MDANTVIEVYIKRVEYPTANFLWIHNFEILKGAVFNTSNDIWTGTILWWLSWPHLHPSVKISSPWVWKESVTCFPPIELQDDMVGLSWLGYVIQQINQKRATPAGLEEVNSRWEMAKDLRMTPGAESKPWLTACKETRTQSFSCKEMHSADNLSNFKNHIFPWKSLQIETAEGISLQP